MLELLKTWCLCYIFCYLGFKLVVFFMRLWSLFSFEVATRVCHIMIPACSVTVYATSTWGGGLNQRLAILSVNIYFSQLSRSKVTNCFFLSFSIYQTLFLYVCFDLLLSALFSLLSGFCQIDIAFAPNSFVCLANLNEAIYQMDGKGCHYEVT